MKVTNIVALAALTALSLGVGSAMAQNSSVTPGNYGTQQVTTPQALGSTVTRTQQRTVQYGSSDHSYGMTLFPDTDRTGGGF